MRSVLPTADELNKAIARICGDRATPYEVPGSHRILGLRVEEVKRLAGKRGIIVPDNLVYGSLEIAGVNAEVEVETSTGTPLVLVNTMFFEFANEFVKIVVQSLEQQSGDQIVISRDPEVLRRRFAADEPRRKNLAALIDYFYGRGSDVYQAPDYVSTRMQFAYTAGIETFAVGHEVGHLIHHDPASSLNWPDVEEELRKLLRLNQASTLTRIRELNADCFALGLVSELQAEGMEERDENKALALYAVEFYFIVHHILEEAAEAAGYGRHPPSFEPQLLGEIPKIVECISRECDLRNTSGLALSITRSDEYPPDGFRRQIVHALIEKQDIQSLSRTDPLHRFITTAETVNQSAEILWDVIKADFVASHRR
jgi:hypothetical protein